jgi:cytochrome c oxidase assembly factor CtaG
MAVPAAPFAADAPVALLGASILGLYALGARRVWAADAAYWPLRTKRGRLPFWRVALFALGLGLVTLGLSGSAAHWAERMLALHAVQHHLLATLGAPLIVLGEPALVFGALIAPWRRARLAMAGRRIAARRLFRWTVGRPLVVWLAHVATVWAGYVPSVHALLYAHPVLHALHHLALLATGIGFWWLLIGPTLTWLPSTRVQRSVATLAAWVQNNALSALIAFSAPSSFPQYRAHRPLWDLTPQEAQYVAGAVQYLPAEIVYLFALSVLVFGWLCEVDRDAAIPPDARSAATTRDAGPARPGLRAQRERLLREEWDA